MALSAFDDKSRLPEEDEIASTLGKSYAVWNKLKSFLEEHYAPLTTEWGFASKSTGWGLRLKQKSRTILYMTPCNGYFLTSFALGEKAVKAAHEAGLSPSTLEAIDGAKKYAEGRGVRFEIRKGSDLRDIEKLAAVKMAN